MIDEKKLIEELNKLPIKTTSKWVETSVNSEVFKEIVTGKYIEKNAVLGTINKQPKVGEWIPRRGCADCIYKECEHYGEVL